MSGQANAGNVAAAAGALTLPSGHAARLFERLDEPGDDGMIYRFRFVSEGFRVIDADADAALADLEFLCQHYALRNLPVDGAPPAQIIISLADREVPFATTDPAATQVFEAFSVENDTCIWEMF